MALKIITVCTLIVNAIWLYERRIDQDQNVVPQHPLAQINVINERNHPARAPPPLQNPLPRSFILICVAFSYRILLHEIATDGGSRNNT
jgi:hypothetical protein